MRHHHTASILMLAMAHGACRARFATVAGAISSDDMTSAISAAIATEDASVATSLAAKADASSVSGLSSGFTAFLAQVVGGPGLAMPLSPATVTGSGTTDQTSDLTLPSNITASNGHSYRIHGTFAVRDSGTKVAEVAVKDLEVKYASAAGGSWSVIKSGEVEYQTETGWDSFFLATAGLPGIGSTGPTLQVITRPLNAAVVTVSADLVIADLGSN